MRRGGGGDTAGRDAVSQALGLNLYSEAELCRGAGGRKSGQWITVVGSNTHAHNHACHAEAPANGAAHVTGMDTYYTEICCMLFVFYQLGTQPEHTYTHTLIYCNI